MEKSQFVHTHLHSQWSNLDGIIRLDELPKAVKSMGMGAVCCTDHGTGAGLYDFVKQCKKEGIKPIPGIEAYWAQDRLSYEPDNLENRYYHLILLAQNDIGLSNLFKMNSQAWEDGLYYKGRIDDKLLEQYNEGLIVTSSCLGGVVAQLLNKGNRAQAEAKILYYKELFKDRFFLELQTHDIDEQDSLNSFLIDMNKKWGLPLTWSGDCHYLKREDGVEKDSIHEILLGVQTGKTIDDPKKFSFDGRSHWVMSPEEVWAIIKKNNFPEECFTNTGHIASMCTGEYFLEKKNHMPKLFIENSEKEFEKKAKWGLVKRFGSIELVPQDYRERLDYELSMIKKMGFADYFLIVEDFTTWAKNNGIGVGTGRGSCAGSLAAWSLGLTAKACDPIKAGLIFERFLNPERVSMPDIDADMSASGRDRVKDYVVSKYGKDYVSGIGTAGLFFPRSAARDVARVMGKDMEFINRFAALVPDNFRGVTPTIEECEKESPQLLEEPYGPLWAKVKRIIGLPRSVGSHAAGLLICTDEPIRNNIPQYRRADSDLMITEFDMGEVEELGYVKFDFLGLKNLDVISETLKLIEHNHGTKVDLDEINYEDPKVFDLINSGKLCGIFQLENSLRSITLRVKPTCIGDLSAVSALGRPGPMDAGLLTQYIENKNEDRKDTEFTGSIDGVLKPILKDTYGVFAYQEQVMKIAQNLCGFSLGKADVLRKAIGKKSREAMAKLEIEFVQGAIANGHDEDQVKRLWTQILGFADYCFNKCLSSDTEVQSTEGIKRIDSLTNKDLVFVFNNGLKEKAKVIETVYAGEQELFEVTLDNGLMVKCSMEHKFVCIDNIERTLQEIIRGEHDILCV